MTVIMSLVSRSDPTFRLLCSNEKGYPLTRHTEYRWLVNETDMVGYNIFGKLHFPSHAAYNGQAWLLRQYINEIRHKTICEKCMTIRRKQAISLIVPRALLAGLFPLLNDLLHLIRVQLVRVYLSFFASHKN